MRAFNGPASQAFTPLLVPEPVFPNAVAWNSSIFQVAAILGPVAGGLLYGWTASPIPVYAGAAVGVLSALVLISLCAWIRRKARNGAQLLPATCSRACVTSGRIR